MRLTRSFGSGLPSSAVLLLLLATAGVARLGAQEPPAAPRVAVIDVQRLLTDSAAGKDVLGRLNELQQEKQATLDSLRADLDRLREEIAAGQLSLSAETLEEKQRALEDGVIELERMQTDADRALQEMRAEEFDTIERAIMPIIERVGSEAGYTMIFNKFQSGLLFAEDRIDITDEVLQRLDAEVPASAPGG